MRYSTVVMLARQRNPKHIVEIGTHDGTRALNFLSACPNAHYYGFDVFEDGDDNLDAYELNVKAHVSVDAVRARLEQAFPKRSTLIRGNTRETLGNYARNPMFVADFVFVDGGHSLDTIESDLRHVSGFTDALSVVICDDWYGGVKEEFLDKWGCNRVLDRLKLSYTVLPDADPIVQGGVVRLAQIHDLERIRE